MNGRTRCGKIVGSVRPLRSEWVYWPEKDWTTGAPGFVTVAPSGARMEWFADEADAMLYVATRNAEDRR